MHTFILQELSTIRGGATTVTQNESGWLELTPFSDLVIFTDCREASGSPTILFQTSPTRDDLLFTAMMAGFALVSNAQTVTKVLLTAATVPVARFVRWQITGAPTWDSTFRVYVAANSPGT